MDAPDAPADAGPTRCAADGDCLVPGSRCLGSGAERYCGRSCAAGSPYGTACPTGYACSGTAGAETCQPAACSDMIDADGDGFPGFPSDPGCTSISDGDETDNCPSGLR